MSDRLYGKHKSQTDEMIAKKKKNMLENLDLIEAKVVQVMDYKDHSKDSFWAYIKASAVDYEIDEATGKVFGNTDTATDFAELWKFIRSDKGWVVDEINQKISVSGLNHLKSVLEA